MERKRMRGGGCLLLAYSSTYHLAFGGSIGSSIRSVLPTEVLCALDIAHLTKKKYTQTLEPILHSGDAIGAL
jgi:hypothetical protein